jgi:hypothetical protein
MTQHRMLANASFRPSESTLTHGMSGKYSRGYPGLPNAAERTFDRTVPGRNNAAIAADRCRQRAYVLRHPTTTLFYYGA